jgi:branched-chain amino acid transport system substrate-binding protein
VISEDADALVMIGFDESSRILSSLFEQGFTPDEKQIYLVDGNIGNATGDDFEEPGTLVGVRGTLPSAELTDEFRDRLLEVDADLTDFSYSAEAYDAVVITALAAIAAESDDPAAIATQINGVTRDGEACETFEDCLALLEDGEDIDYNGPSGPQEFSQPGEPTAASFAIMSYGDDNQIDEEATEYRQASL